MNRRAFLCHSAALLTQPPERDARRGLSENLARRLNDLAVKWDAARAAITTAAAMEERNRFVRESVRRMLNVPPTAAPVRAKVTATQERAGYRIENVMFESCAGLWVTGNLYVPTGVPGPFPGVISPCGHYELARMYADYQFAYIDMARAGFVVLAYDPTGQGERHHYGTELRSVDEHSMEGQLLLLLGENLTGYLVGDGMRAIDYLQSRPEVDARRIACAGHSGGGTQTMFLACADERIGCVVINEGGTAHRWPVTLKADGSAPISDAEQNLFPSAVDGIDTCDMHAAVAPRPLLVLIENYNPAFDLSAAHIRARYELLGAGERFATEEAQARHAWTQKLRLATVDWLCRWMKGTRGPSEEPALTAEKPETLYCTPKGTIEGADIFTVIRSRAEQLAAHHAMPDAGQVRRLLRVPTAVQTDVRVIEKQESNGVRVQTLEIPTEPGTVITARVRTPARVKRTPLLVLGGEVEAEDAQVITLKVRGEAPAAAQAKPFAHLFDAETACAYMAWYMDLELLGLRVYDVLQTMRAMTLKQVRVLGIGPGALWALFAAALDERVEAVTCRGGLVSYQALATTDRYRFGAASFVRGILREFDLPQLAASLAPRAVTIEAPVDAMGVAVTEAALRQSYAPALQRYRQLGAEQRLRLSADVL